MKDRKVIAIQNDIILCDDGTMWQLFKTERGIFRTFVQIKTP